MTSTSIEIQVHGLHQSSLLTRISPAPMTGRWLTEFHPFTVFHLASVAGCAAITAIIIGRGLRWRGTPREVRLRTTCGWVIALWQIPANAYYLLPGHFDPGKSFPFQLCDLGAILAGAAMITHLRPLRTVLYFWAFGLSTQAFFTPALLADEGLSHPHFWLFWIGHTQIVGAGLYDLIVGRYRPRYRDFWVAFFVTLVYILIALALDIRFGLNYGFVGDNIPNHPSIVEVLGPWPQRIFIIAALATGVFLFLWAIWPASAWLLARIRHPRSAPPTGRS